MSENPSGSQPTAGMVGSGTLSHAYIQYPPLRCCIPGSSGLFYDDGNKLLLSPMSNQVFSWKTVPFDPHVAPTSDSISEGPVMLVRYSLDGKFIAVQRSHHEIQFWNRETGETFSQRCRSESESILGFFWTDCPLGDIVLVKTSGLDMFAYNSESKSLHLVETRKLNVSWYVYTHESRLVLLASGMQCKTLIGYQISSAGIVRLPKFEMAMAISESNSKPVLAAEDVYIITIYSRIYCLQVDRAAMLLHSYRFYRDAVVQQGSLPIYSSKISLSVVDNVLLIHQVEAKVVILYDIFTDTRAPVSAPLPLLFRGFPGSDSFSQSSYRDTECLESSVTSDHEAVIYGDDWTFLVPDLICDVASKSLWKIHLDLEAIATSSSEVPSVLEFLQRRKLEASKAKELSLVLGRTMILERRPVSVVANAIDVLVTSYSLSIKTGTYLKVIKIEKASPSGAPHVSGPRPSFDASANSGQKSLHHNSASEVAVNRSSDLASDSDENANFGSVNTNSINMMVAESSGSEAQTLAQIVGPSNNPLDTDVPEQQDYQLASPAISPDEMYSFIFAPVEEELGVDPSYLVSIIVEFLRSANSEKIKVYPNINVLTIQLLTRCDRYAELGLFVMNKILEPSKEVALQLVESGRQNFQTRKLGLDMLRQLSLHQDYILLLMQDGYYLEALRYARREEVTTIQPSLFLEPALASKDPQRLAAVLRFFLDFIPGFRDTSDHETYLRILNEMNSPVVA